MMESDPSGGQPALTHLESPPTAVSGEEGGLESWPGTCMVVALPLRGLAQPGFVPAAARPGTHPPCAASRPHSSGGETGAAGPLLVVVQVPGHR